MKDCPSCCLIAIAGLIGSGKTTLARQLAQRFEAHLVQEEYDRNPFLAHQLLGDREAGLASELFFLLSRSGQLDLRQLAPYRFVVTDYLFEKNRVFAEMNLSAEELAIFSRMENVVKKYIARPALVIYLHDTPQHCLERIQKRGREFEQQISTNWLERLSQTYEAMLAAWSTCPVYHVDRREMDLLKPECIDLICEQARQYLHHSHIEKSSES